MNITKELITEGEAEKLEKELKSKQYTAVLLQGRSDAAAIKTINTWARWSLYSLTRKDNRSKLHLLRIAIRNRIKTSGQILANRDPAAGRRFREIVCNAVASRAAELMDNHFAVRLNAILILSQMNVVEYNQLKKTLPIAYIPAADILIDKVMKDPTQPQPVLVVAVNGIRRLALLGQPKEVMRRKMANALIPILRNKKNHPWLLARTAKALGAIGVKTNLAGKAFIIQVLMETMADKNLPPQVRTEAARALGRADIHTNVDVPLIAFEIAKLTQEMSEKYNAEQKAGGRKISTHWPTSFFNIFLAFHAMHKEERQLYGARKPGLLSRYRGKAFVDGPYQKIKPVVSFMLTQPVLLNPNQKNVLKRNFEYKKINDGLIADLASWQSNNPPSATTVQPGMPAFRTGGKAVSSKRSKTLPVSSKQ